jgi:hypothetical protein
MRARERRRITKSCNEIYVFSTMTMLTALWQRQALTYNVVWGQLMSVLSVNELMAVSNSFKRGAST